MVQLLGRLSLPWLIMGFVVGLFATWMVAPKKRVVIEFPSPYNAGHVTYTGEGGRCFQYRADIVQCPDDDKDITAQPLPRKDVEKFEADPSCMFLQDCAEQLHPRGACATSCAFALEAP